MKHTDFFRRESDYPLLDSDGAVQHLRQALRFNTTSYVDVSRVDYSAFEAMHAYIKESYPNIMASCRWETVGHNLLVTIPGTDPSLKPALFMAHQDVVPADGEWEHAPFSGDLADGYIWGRGALDIKEMLIAEFESVEYLLSQGFKFRRTVYLAYAEDEETNSLGVRELEKLLASRGTELEYVLDESAPGLTDAADWGAPGQYIHPIGTYEKGYCDLRLTTGSRGGHSSNPFRGTSLGTIAEAICAVKDNMPPARLQESLISSFEELKPYITREPLKTMASNPRAYEKELIDYFLSKESLYHLVKTTCAPTMISGGSAAGNIMPRDMQANINMRLIPDDTPESLIERFRKVVNPEVKLEWAQCISASTPSDTASYGYRNLKKVLESYFGDIVFIPQQARCATDARWYEPLCRCVMRFSPFIDEPEIMESGIHGTNERISVRAYLHGIRVLISMMENTCL